MKDIIYVEHKHFISTKKESFRFVNTITKNEFFVPFDEVDYLIFDNEHSYFSKSVVSACLQRNIGIIFCDAKHVPITTITSEFGYYQRLKNLELQWNLSSKIKKRLWRKIVISKINNQASCLDEWTNQKETVTSIILTGKQVTEGDQTNREAYASRLYFSALFGKDFRRGRFEDSINAGLNYGYALLRAAIRKEIVYHGLEPSLGIHHCSSENPFNLSDDLIEPFRPFVDAFVYEKIYVPRLIDFDLETKKELLKVLFEKCVIDGKVYSLSDAIKVSAESLLIAIKKDKVAPLLLPSFIEGGK